MHIRSVFLWHVCKMMGVFQTRQFETMQTAYAQTGIEECVSEAQTTKLCMYLHCVPFLYLACFVGWTGAAFTHITDPTAHNTQPWCYDLSGCSSACFRFHCVSSPWHWHVCISFTVFLSADHSPWAGKMFSKMFWIIYEVSSFSFSHALIEKTIDLSVW